MYKYCAGIVTYNPDISLLERNIRSIYSQVNEVIIVDNGSRNINEIEQMNSVLKFTIIKNNDNKGIAYALNQLMYFSKEKNYEWVISLDQDSVCPLNYVEKIREYESEQNVAIICPVIVDRDIGQIDRNINGNIEEVNEAITSAACTKVEAWESVGRYDEFMFIDSVDFEFCYRIKKEGYRILRINNLVLNHKIGNGKLVDLLLVKIWVKNHSAFRKYYIARNMIYLCRKHGLYKRLIKSYLRIIWLIIVTILFESDKNSKVNALIKGIRDGNSYFL